jgi:hypothetical protein
MYGYYTRGEQLGTFKWPRVRCVVDPVVANCTIGHVYSETRGHKATCFIVHVANCQPRALLYTWQNFRNLIFLKKLINLFVNLFLLISF